MTAWTTVKCMLGCNVTPHVYIGVMRQSWTFIIFCAGLGRGGECDSRGTSAIIWSWCKTQHIWCSARSYDVGFIFTLSSPLLCCTVIQLWLWTLFSLCCCPLDSQAIAEISLSGTSTDKRTCQRSAPVLMFSLPHNIGILPICYWYAAG